jgi:outer membrane receptor for ferric coprogen and ferric-rhodotorulic acid
MRTFLFGASALSLMAGASAVLAQDAGQSDEAPSRVEDVTVRAERGSYATRTVAIAGKEPVPVLEVPNSVSIVTRQRIEDQNLVTMTDALREVTGVHVTTWDGLIGQIRSRGYLLDVSYDGIPTYSASQVQEFDLAVYEQVEVLRGPAGIFKGSGQPGGTANFVRKRAGHEAAFSGVASAGTWANYRVEGDVGGPIALDGRLRGRLVASALDRDFYTDRSHEQKTVGYAVLDFDVTDRTLVSLMATYQDDRGDALNMGLANYVLAGSPLNGRFLDVPRSTNQYPDWNLNEYTTTEYAGELRHAFANEWVIRSKAGFRQQHKTYEDGFPTPGTGLNPVTNRFSSYNRRSNRGRTNRDGFDLYASGPVEFLGREHQLTVGYSWELYDFLNRGQNAAVFTGTPAGSGIALGDAGSVPKPNFIYNNGTQQQVEQTGVYGQGRFSLIEGLSLVLGARVSDFESRSRNIAPHPNPTDYVVGAVAEGEITPYAGVVYYVRPNITVYGSYSDIFIPQTALRVDGSVLDPRIGKQVEVGVKGSFFQQRLNASLAVFNTRDENRSLADVANPGFFVQAGEVEVRGADLEIAGSPWEGLDLTAGYSWIQTEYLTHATLVGQAFDTWEPEHTFKLFAKYTPDAPGWDRSWIAVGLQAQSTLVGAGQADVREQKPYAIASLHGGYALSPTLSLTVSANNVFDKTYFARVGGPNTYNTYGDPRNIVVGLRARF